MHLLYKKVKQIYSLLKSVIKFPLSMASILQHFITAHNVTSPLVAFQNTHKIQNTVVLSELCHYYVETMLQVQQNIPL